MKRKASNGRRAASSLERMVRPLKGLNKADDWGIQKSSNVYTLTISGRVCMKIGSLEEALTTVYWGCLAREKHLSRAKRSKPEPSREKECETSSGSRSEKRCESQSCQSKSDIDLAMPALLHADNPSILAKHRVRRSQSLAARKQA